MLGPPELNTNPPRKCANSCQRRFEAGLKL